MEDSELLRDQIAYYRARATEYDEWFLRQGRYDRGAQHREAWFAEIDQLREALLPQIPRGSVLELACGTGLWTELLAQRAIRVVALDSSPEVIALNSGRLKSDHVEYVVADLFSWTTAATFDLIFFSFWLSHVPDTRFEEFWNFVRARLNQQGRVFFIDSLLEQTSTASDHGTLDASGVVHRRLNDGRSFQIVKVFHEPRELARRLNHLGWQGEVQSSGRFFYFGSMKPAVRVDRVQPS